jgi:hypothetical protein
MNALEIVKSLIEEHEKQEIANRAIYNFPDALGHQTQLAQIITEFDTLILDTTDYREINVTINLIADAKIENEQQLENIYYSNPDSESAAVLNLTFTDVGTLV